MSVEDRRIGAARVTRIEEQMGPGFPADQFFPEFDAATFKAQEHWLAPRYYAPEQGRLIASIHSWLIRMNGLIILVDACSGNHKPRPGMPRFDNLNTPYLDRLRAAGVQPEEIDLVLCTHLHIDHVGWNTRLDNGRWVPTFPKARYVMSRTDHAFWAEASRDPARAEFERNTYNDSVLPIVEAGLAEMVDGEHDLGRGLMIRPSPGHTPGHIRIDLESDGKRAMFSGDALHNPVQVPLWRWNSRFCEDLEQARTSRHDLLADCAEQHALLMPAHFAPPHAAFIAAKGNSFALEWDWS
jgi:glyoxylase-like metal-dependent hydrolase (beta-lactamase superfamily II)